MTAVPVAVASSSRLAADAGLVAARAGGNAVDAALAACLTAMITQPGVCSLGASGYVTVWPADTPPVTVDGQAAMPGRGMPPDHDPVIRRVELAYGGGVNTIVGFGSVAVPGGVAALGQASRHYGALPWNEVVEPARRAAEDGFPMPANCHHYLEFAMEPVLGWLPESREAFLGPAGRLPHPGERMWLPGLAATMGRLAEEGPELFYTGALGRAIADYISGQGGSVTREDMAGYRARARASLQVPLDEWRIATTPPPAAGGACLGAMLLLMSAAGREGWTAPAVRRLVESQRTVMAYRAARLGADAADLGAAVSRLLDAAAAGRVPAGSGATVHTSAVDGDGLACSVTMSAGYGSGVVIPGTGCWMNNCLGEIELTGGDLLRAPPGTRLPSNMAPSVARHENGRVLAVGSPGAERITTALQQTLVGHLHFGMGLAEAVAHPRLHVEEGPEGWRVACEPGLPMEEVDLPLRPFEQPSMFFGGVAAVEFSPATGFSLAGDPRREGGTACTAAAP